MFCMNNIKETKTRWIKDRALELGFLSVGIAKAEFMQDEAEKLKEWLGLSYQGEMSYLASHFEKRVDPTLLVEGAKSVISFAFNYYTDTKQEDPTAPKISTYAYGRDYHKVVKSRLKKLYKEFENKWGKIHGRFFIDSGPVLERDWAKRSGVGWTGKNTLTIHPKKGSYFFLAEMIIDVELEYDEAIEDFCGTCTRCIEACPTDAIKEEGYQLDAKKCISYLTIELKNEIPLEFKDKMENWIYGCDICQEVCPWNKFSKEHTESDFLPSEEFLKMSKSDWHELTEEKFDRLFFGSAVKRTQFKGLKRNINFLKSD